MPGLGAQGDGTRLRGVQGGKPFRTSRPFGHRPRPLFHHRLLGPLERSALSGPPCRRVLRTGPQRKPDQRGRTSVGARGEGIDLPVHHGQRGDHPSDGPPSEGGVGKGPDKGAYARARGLQHRHADPEPGHCHPRPPRIPAACPGPLQRRLGGGLGNLRLRLGGGEIPPGCPARRDRHHRRPGPSESDAVPRRETLPLYF